MKNKHGCQMNFMGRFFEELPWRVVQQLILEEDPWLFRRVIQQFTSEGCPIEFIDIMFSRIKTFCFENSVFSHLPRHE